ncbi:unnamed protein product, partial [Ixodes hexagonus]
MADVHNSERTCCADYDGRHRKKTYRNERFRSVKDLDVNLVRSFLSSHSAAAMKDTDMLCQNCFTRLGEKLSASCASELSSSSCPSVLSEHEVLKDLNEEIAGGILEATPLKVPSAINPKSRKSYLKRKQGEIEAAFSRKVAKKLATAYGTEPSSSTLPADRSCFGCDEWWLNMRQAFAKALSNRERCQLLTLIPSSITVVEAKKLIPEASKYLLRKSRQLQTNFGPWKLPDLHTGQKVSDEVLQLATEYYTNDDLDCSVQSPNTKDAVKVIKDGKKEVIVKRYMTRSIRETYLMFRKANPDAKLGITKFYSLRPKWVKINPKQTVCACVYCTNFDLCFSALTRLREGEITKQALISMCLCSEPTPSCLRCECKECPNARNLTSQILENLEEEHVTFCMWEKGDLIEKTTEPHVFLKELQTWTIRYISHDYIRNLQRDAIRLAKTEVAQKRVVLHFDFAENWTVALPNEIQEYHWHKHQISIFTCVASTAKGPQSFGVVSEDLCDDTPHALLAIRLIEDWLEDNVPVYSSITYVSDGAASHFKNRYQLFEFAQGGSDKARWLFSASGHGKNSCDGVGGLLKHLATVHNFRSQDGSLIRTSKDFVEQIKTLTRSVVLFDLPEKEIETFRKHKKEEW